MRGKAGTLKSYRTVPDFAKISKNWTELSYDELKEYSYGHNVYSNMNVFYVSKHIQPDLSITIVFN